MDEKMVPEMLADGYRIGSLGLSLGKGGISGILFTIRTLICIGVGAAQAPPSCGYLESKGGGSQRVPLLSNKNSF